MGVDFYSCDICDETFSECGDHSTCDDCYKKLCGSCMESWEVGPTMIDISKDPENEYGHSECMFCSECILDDVNLLEFAVQLLDITLEELSQKYRERK